MDSQQRGNAAHSKPAWAEWSTGTIGDAQRLQFAPSIPHSLFPIPPKTHPEEFQVGAQALRFAAARSARAIGVVP